MNILIVYASKEGQTEKIASFIAGHICQRGHQATAISCRHLPKNFTTLAYDAVIIGASIHMDSYPMALTRFVRRYRDWLNQVPSAFFTVCMAIHSKNEKERTQARDYSLKFIRKTNWQPNLVETFAGAIRYTQYGFITRKIMQQIARKEGGNTDTSRDHEYTDWGAVTQFTELFVTAVGNPA